MENYKSKMKKLIKYSISYLICSLIITQWMGCTSMTETQKGKVVITVEHNNKN